MCWGTSDFIGGYVSRTANPFIIALIAHGSGLLMVAILAVVNHSPYLHKASVMWALVAGASGGAALAFFYRALSTGQMGLVAPVAAVLSAAIPVVFSVIVEGAPQSVQIAGFVSAGFGIWLISRSEGRNNPRGIGIAMLAGMGFAGFYLGMRQAGQGSAFWLAVASRGGAFVITALMILIGKVSRTLNWRCAALGAIAGCVDVSGTVLFVRASQAGRLDTSVVLVSLYPVVTVTLAWLVLKEHFTRWKLIGMLAALAAVPMIAR
jgi:drug/metabolite transporter (DMT)-like permease